MKLRTSLIVLAPLIVYVGVASTWTIRQNEEGVRIRLGRPVGTVAGGLHVTLPYPIERIVRVAARLATRRRGKLCSVDKANVLETSRLWRDTTDRLLASEFPSLELETLLVDAAAMHLLSRPAAFDG